MATSQSVSSIMTPKVITIDLDDPLDQVEQKFKANQIRHAPVLSNGKLKGILSLTDLQRLSFASEFGEEETDVDNAVFTMLSVEQVMVSNPVCIQIDQSIKEAAEILSQNEFHALPVVNPDNELAGIVTTTDLIRFLVNHLD